MMTSTKFKGIRRIDTIAHYETLVSTGTVTINNVVITYDPDYLYIVDESNYYTKSQIDSIAQDYVQKATKIAGIDLQDDITKNELAHALGMSPDLNVKNGSTNGSLTQTNLSYNQMIEDFEPNMVAYVSYIGAGVSSPTSEQLIALLNSDKTNPYVAGILGNYTFEQYCQGFLAGTGSIQPGVSNKTAIDTLIVQQLTDRWDVSSSDDLSNTFGPAADGAFAAGFKNKVYSPAAVTFGFDNQAGDEGYPSESIGAIALGYKTKALGNQSIVIGTGDETLGDLVAEGQDSIALGEVHSQKAADFPEDGGQRASALKFLDNLITAGVVDSTESGNINYEWIWDGVHSPHNLSYSGYINEKAGSNNFSFGPVIVGLDDMASTGNAGFGVQNVISGHNNFMTGLVNSIYAGSTHTVGGAYNKVDHGGQNAVFGWNNSVNYRFNGLVAGYFLKSENPYNDPENMYSETPKTRLGRYNADNVDHIFQIGNGTADNARSNAFAITDSGYIVLPNYDSVSATTPIGYKTFKCVNGVLTAID